MFTESIPTYDLKGNKVSLPHFASKDNRKNIPDRKALAEIMKMFMDALQEEDKNREETLSELKMEVNHLKKMMISFDYSVLEEQLAHIIEMFDEMKMEMEKDRTKMKEMMEKEEKMKAEKETMENKHIDNSDIRKLITKLYDAIKDLPAPQIILPESIKENKKEESSNLMRPASGKRIKIKWVVATSPQASGTEAIIGTIDGVNKDFYVSGSPIKNSEQIRLNQGSPMSYGEDYTNTANKYSFVVAPPVGSKMEIKWQSR